jgi:outer membrane autotransporter protein
LEFECRTQFAIANSTGLEVRLTDWLVAGGAFTYLESDTRSTANLGSNDLDGQVYSIYATAFHGNAYLDVLYSYGDFENGISRKRCSDAPLTAIPKATRTMWHSISGTRFTQRKTSASVHPQA